MRKLTTITDPVYHKKEKFNALERFFLKYIKDERDLPFIYLCLKLSLLNVPIAILLFTPLFTGWLWWVVGFIYAGLIIYYAGSFTLMLHNTSHRPFFKREYNVGNYFVPWFLSLFMGQSPETYFSHHIGMHHAENNLHADKSSTMNYQRDNIWDFLKYMGRFISFGIPDLVLYFRERQYWKFVKMVVRGEVAYIILCIAMSFVSLQATLWVLVTPLFITRFSMMAGNWGQHAFIDAATPENNYRNSITCINSDYNKKCFNDGYHIGHHLRPHMHWTDMPTDFLKNKQKYADEEAIVLEGLDYMAVWLCLMFKRYDLLAARFINLGNRYNSEEEVIQLLKKRTMRIEP